MGFKAAVKADILNPLTHLPIAAIIKSPIEGRQLREFADTNRKTDPLVVARQDAFKGQTVALCGAGPSLRDADIKDVDLIFGCNSAVGYLMDNGINVAGAIAIDQTARMYEHDWANPPEHVMHFVASTVDPELVKTLQRHNVTPVFFHNCVGWGPDGCITEDCDLCDPEKPLECEFAYYRTEWPTPMVLIGGGRTVVGRAVELCDWLGFERVDVYGADHAFGDNDVAHANGDSAAEAYGNPGICEGVIDGRVWRTRLDMLIGAVTLARRARDSNGFIRLFGDTLPNALINKPDEFLDLVARQMSPDETAELVAQLEQPHGI